MEHKVVLLLVLFHIAYETSGYKILGLLPYNGKSHMAMFGSIMESLALKGHEVHVLSHYPRETPLPNYTDFSLVGSIPLPNEKLSVNSSNGILNKDIIAWMQSIIRTHEDVMKAPAVQKLLRSKERYDLIITESFATDMTLGFVHKFKVPFVFVTSSALTPWTSDFMANPQNPAFVPHFLSRFSPKMTFFERIGNTAELLTLLGTWYGVFLPANQEIMNKHFGSDTPPLLDIIKNVSLTLVNSHPTIHGARPFVPNIIEVGGIHIKPPGKLPPDIQKFIDESTHGVVYFCMGSLIRGASFPEAERDAFLRVFSKLKERVLWKFEDEIKSVPDNVMIKQWMPQRDILAHPKVKLFISHGGLQGSLEAVNDGIPVLGIPVLGDQIMNLRSLELQGMAKVLNPSSVDEESIYKAVREMLEPKYAARAKELARLFHDRPMSPTDTAVYWIEYVIRNKGARNLRSIAVDLPFYQYLLLDVILFSILCVVSTGLIFYSFFRCCQKRNKKLERSKKKMKKG